MRETKVVVKAFSPKNQSILLLNPENGIESWFKMSEKVLDFVAGRDLKEREMTAIFDDSNKVVMLKPEQQKKQQEEAKNDRENYWEQRLELDKGKNREVRRLALLNTAIEILKLTGLTGEEAIPGDIISLAKELEKWVMGVEKW